MASDFIEKNMPAGAAWYDAEKNRFSIQFKMPDPLDPSKFIWLKAYPVKEKKTDKAPDYNVYIDRPIGEALGVVEWKPDKQAN